MWWYASLPFTILGWTFCICGMICLFVKNSGETTEDCVRQFITGMIIGGAFLFIAAMIAS